LIGRRIAAAAFATSALAAVAAGCGGGDNKAGGDTATTAAPKGLVVLVTDVNQLNDRGFNQLAYTGLKRAQKELGVKGVVYQSQSSQAYIPNLSTAARNKADLVVAVGFDMTTAVGKVSKQFPDTKFAIIDVDVADLGSPKNVVGLIFKEQEAGYLAGYLAALVDKDGGTGTISAVGGQKQPPVDRFIAGYQAGAKKADPGIKLTNGYSQDWVDKAKCKTLALDQIAAGSDVVFSVAGGCGLGALDAAKEKGVWGVGVDADQYYLGSHILTSAIKRVDVSVYDTVQQALDGTFEGGTNSVFDLKNDGVGLGKINPKVPKADVQKVEQVRRDIASGAIKGIPTEVG
jgi:basic membrane protein A